MCAEQNVENLENVNVQEFWDSCAQNKTSEISKNALSRIPGLLCAEQDVGNLNKMYFQELWDSCAQNTTSEILKKCTFRNSETPVRRTNRRQSQKMSTLYWF